MADLTDTVNNVDLKLMAQISEKVGALLTESLQQHVAHTNRVNAIAETGLQAFIKASNEMDPVQALSLVKGFSASDATPDLLSKFAAIIAQVQQLMKGAQTTPPVTP